MLIISKLTYDRKSLRLLAAEGADGSLPIAYAKGDAQTQVVPTGPFGPQIPFINELFQNAGNLLRTGESPGIASPEFFPGSTVAATPQSLAGNQQNILDFIGQQQPVNTGVINTAVDAANTAGQNPASQVTQPLQDPLQAGLLSLISGQNPQLGFAQEQLPGVGNTLSQIAATGTSAPTPGATPGAPNAPQSGVQGGLNTAGAPQSPVSGIDIAPELQTSLQGGSLNPFLDQVVQAATRSAGRQFQDTTLPGIRQDANLAGQRGGSRQGIAEGIAGSRFQEDVGDITARLFANAFDAGSAERGQALGILGQDALQQPQIGLDTARINEAISGGAANRQLTASDLILQQLAGGTNVASGNVGTGTAQVGDLLTTGTAQGQNQLFNALGLIPNLQAGGLAQLGAGNQIGLQQLGLDQAQLDDQVQRFFFEQFAPHAALAQFQNFIGGNFGSSVQ